MHKWIAYLYYTNGKTQEFFFEAADNITAYEKVATIFPNIRFLIKQKHDSSYTVA